MKMPSSAAGEAFVLSADQPVLVRNVDERLVSYNIEMTEITGGTFWKSYTPEQIAGTEDFPVVGPLRDVTSMPDLTQYYPPIDLYHDRLRGLAKKLGPTWVRVSGTWATKTYYDFDGVTGGKAPAGYASVLTREQWIGVLDFVRYVGAKLLISVSNCAGDHPDGGPLDLTQAKKIFDFSHGYGVEIDAVEFMNEPNMLEMSGSPAGYTAADYARDQDILYTWVRANYPNCLLVGPCTTGDPTAVSKEGRGFGAGIGSLSNVCTTEELLAGTTVKLDVFSYHYYNGISERLASVMPRAHWPAELAHTKELHVYCRSRKDGAPGMVYLVINNSLTEDAAVEVPREALRYMLHADSMRSPSIRLNGKELSVSGVCDIPELAPEQKQPGTVLLPPGSCTFFVL